MKNLKLLLISLVLSSAVLASCANSIENELPLNTSAETQKQTTVAMTTEAMTTVPMTTEETKQVVVETTQETYVKENNQMDNGEFPSTGDGILVAYFSATGTTKRVAEKIAELTGADLYEIEPKNPYSDADLNWNDRSSRSTKEMDDPSVRPEIGSIDIDLFEYKTIYLGYPIWWGDAPRIMSTFVEKYKFDGIKVIPFCTSGGSGIGRSGSNLASLAGSGDWRRGERLNSSADTNNIQSFINNNK